jgi:uncharacterized spore protein YtfJ
MHLDDSIEKTLNEIQKVMSTNSIVGTPITTKDKTIIPISKTALGFGVGVGNNAGKNETELGGAGGGGSIDPVALLIVYTDIPGPNGVELVPIDKEGTSIEDVISSITKIASGFLQNSNVEPATEVSSEGSIDKIKTKIKK